MKIQSTSFDNVYLIHEDVHSDDRGIFMETYNELSYTKKSLLFDIESEMAMKDDGTIYTTYFVQDNLSVSKKKRIQRFTLSNRGLRTNKISQST